MLDRFGERSGALITREETWKERVSGTLQRSGTARQVLTDEQRARVEASLRHELYTRLRDLDAS